MAQVDVRFADGISHGGFGSLGVTLFHRVQDALVVRHRVQPVAARMVLDAVAGVQRVDDHNVEPHHQFVVGGPQQVQVKVLVGRGEPFYVPAGRLELRE